MHQLASTKSRRKGRGKEREKERQREGQNGNTSHYVSLLFIKSQWKLPKAMPSGRQETLGPCLVAILEVAILRQPS